MSPDRKGCGYRSKSYNNLFESKIIPPNPFLNCLYANMLPPDHRGELYIVGCDGIRRPALDALFIHTTLWCCRRLPLDMLLVPLYPI